MRAVRFWGGAALLAWALACSVQQEAGGDSDLAPASDSEPVITEHRPLTAEQATKELGEECD